MSKNKTEHSTFRSAYAIDDNFISEAQYITEKLCEMVAKQEGKSLTVQFWKEKRWATFFRQQIPAANKLLKQYSAGVILSTLKDKRCWKLKSLRAKWLLDPILEEYKEKEKYVIVQETKAVDTEAKPQRFVGKPTILSKLRGL